MDRRAFLVSAAAAGAGAAALRGGQPAPAGTVGRAPEGGWGRLRPSVCRWCYGGMSLEDLCAMCRRLGVESIELLSEKDWGTVERAGLRCAVANGPVSIQQGINRHERHGAFAKECERLIPLVKRAGIPNLIVFSGNRAGQSDAEGLDRCAAALKRVVPIAEAEGVTIVMELLNSKVDHGDYQCDRTSWGVELCRRVGSERFGLLYDIYHMQIMEGDVIRTVTANMKWIRHFHTAGVPGRHEIDASQELNYPAICRAIADAGYTGYLGQEFLPRGDAEASLRGALEACRV
ncbi:MAG: TIM barrel protein [Phycisphaerae bacterium]|nr:TIM barrel protein [Phycisphaerae bacterium]